MMLILKWFYKVEKRQISIAYEHENYKNGVMRSRDFAKSLLAFSELLDEINRAFNKETTTIEIDIKADFKNKCFMVDLLIQVNILKDLLLSGHQFSLDDIFILCGFITDHPKIVSLGAGIIFSYPAWKVISRGKELVVGKNSKQKGDAIKVVLRDRATGIETEHAISISLFGLIKYTFKHKQTNKNIQEAFKDHLDTVGDTQYRENNKILGEVSAEDKKNILPCLSENQKEKPVLYESVELRFSTVSEVGSGRTYSGYVLELDQNPKKIVFHNNYLKDQFEFKHEPFTNKYLTSVLVSFNENGSIAQYRIMEFLGILN